MFGIELTNTRAPGCPATNVLRAERNWLSKVAVGVIVPALEVHTSLAPMRTVAYSTLAGRAANWVPSSAILAPVRAAFVTATAAPFRAVWMRRAWLLTLPLFPVDHEYWGQSANRQPRKVASNPRVMESPVAPITPGSGGAAAATPGAPTRS